MSTSGLQGIQLAAALAEQIYHRNSADGSIQLSSLDGAQAIGVGDLRSAGLTDDSSVDGVTYYSPRGFAGEVVRQGGTLYVVLRGTDLSASFLDGFKAALPDLATLDIALCEGALDASLCLGARQQPGPYEMPHRQLDPLASAPRFTPSLPADGLQHDLQDDVGNGFRL